MNKDVLSLLDVYSFKKDSFNKDRWYRNKREQTEILLFEGNDVIASVDGRSEPDKDLLKIADSIRKAMKTSTEQEKTDNAPLEDGMEEYEKYIKKIEENRDDVVRWLTEEVAPKAELIDEICYRSKLSDFRREILSLCVTPLHYFIEGDGITDKQGGYLKTLCDSARKRAYSYLNQHEELPRGGYEEVIPQLTKTQASNFISYMKGKTDVNGKVIE